MDTSLSRRNHYSGKDEILDGKMTAGGVEPLWIGKGSPTLGCEMRMPPGWPTMEFPWLKA